jgi:alpha-L-fucosidase
LQFRRLFDRTFSKDLAKGAQKTYSLANEPTNVSEVVLSFSKPITFNIVRLREYVPLGQRVEAFELDQWSDGSWKLFAQGTSIGNCRLTRTNPLTTTKVRLRITQTAAPPAISEIGLFYEQNVRQAVSLSPSCYILDFASLSDGGQANSLSYDLNL